MSRITLYHNPACSKSRAALALLEDKGVELVVVEYLKKSMSRDELTVVLAKLPGEVDEYYRRDDYWKSLGLDEANFQGPDEVIELLLDHPRLLQRPIAVRGRRAVIGRPPENVLVLLEEE